MRAVNLEVGARGKVTLPKTLRESLNIDAGDTVKAVQVGDAVVLMRRRADLDALRRKCRRMMRLGGVTRNKLVQGL